MNAKEQNRSTVGDTHLRLTQLLLFAFEYPPVSGGISRLCGGIAEALASYRVCIRVLTQNSANCVGQALLPIARVHSLRPLREWQAFRWLRNYRSSMTPNDCAIVCGIWYPEGLIAYLAGWRPLIILAHGAELLPCVGRWHRRLRSALQQRVLESADLLIANSEYTQKLVSTTAPQANVKAIPPAVDVDRFAPGDRNAAKAKFGVENKRVISTVSRIHHYKGHETVLRAIANLAVAEREQLVYLVAGEGPYESELKKRTVALGIENHVGWLGFVAEEGLRDIYLASDLFVLCTRDAPEERAVEGFGLVFLEAQACGTPVVGTRTGGIPTAIRDGDGGWLMEQDDVEKLTHILRELLLDPQSFHNAGLHARQRVLRECTWKSFGERFASALQGVGVGCEKGEAPTASIDREQGVSVVIPTLNREQYLVNAISDLLAQEHRPVELVIVDQSSAENSSLTELVRKNPELISYHKVNFRGLPCARNYGWQHAKHDAIVFVDDDIRCGPSFVSHHLRSLSQPNAGMVAGGVEESIPGLDSSPGRFNSWTATPERNFGATTECTAQHVPGTNFSAWRAVLQAAGGFDEALAGGAALYEETELCLRVRKLGYEIYFNGAARVEHLAAGSGGCRVPDIPKYVASLAHNRAILIMRHLRWFQIPVAYLRLLLLLISYTVHYRTIDAFRSGFIGFRNGLRCAKRTPLSSQYESGLRV
jgi:phosphatidyl-myo-inositol dimannoside synthase